MNKEFIVTGQTIDLGGGRKVHRGAKLTEEELGSLKDRFLRAGTIAEVKKETAETADKKEETTYGMW